MACCAPRLPSASSLMKLQRFGFRSCIRNLSGTQALLSNDKSDGDLPEQPLAAAAAASHAPATTRGPRRKKVGEAVLERKHFSPEFMPPAGRRSKLKDYLERQDCYSRRKLLDIPEFYPGSILAVTVSDPYAPGKESRFVGICLERKNFGLGASFKLRNVIDEQGVEINYQIYSPLIKKLEVLRLERRLDGHLLYLRDALPEYSTIDPEMTMIKHPPGKPVPVSDLKVKMKPKPWHKRWERFGLQGIDMTDVLSQERIDKGKEWLTPEYEKMDLLNIFQASSHSNEDRLKIKQDFDRHIEEMKRKKNKLRGGS